MNAEEADNESIELISIEEVMTFLQKMKKNKVLEPGDLPIELVKQATIKVVEILCNIM